MGKRPPRVVCKRVSYVWIALELRLDYVRAAGWPPAYHSNDTAGHTRNTTQYGAAYGLLAEQQEHTRCIR